MDPAVQLVWLHFSHHAISGSATLGAFVLGRIYREWTPLLNRKESLQRLVILLSQISKEVEHGAGVVVHCDFNIDLDRADNKGYYMGAMLTSLAKCTTSAGLETLVTGPTFRLFGSFRPQGSPLSPARDLPSPTGDGTRPAGGGQSPTGSGPSPAGNYHRYSRLDHVYTKGLISESLVLPDSMTDHRPVVTTVRAGSQVPGAEKLVSLKGRNFKAVTRPELEGALNLTDWSKVYDLKDVDAVPEYITSGITSALNIVAPKKAIRVKKGPNLYLTRETLETMNNPNAATSKRFRSLRNKVTRLVRRDKQDSNLLSLKKAKTDPKVLLGLADQALGKDRPSLPASVTGADRIPHNDHPGGRGGGEQVLRGRDGYPPQEISASASRRPRRIGGGA
jgi:hypothetical protein